MNQEKWDKRFLQMAELVASWSKDPSTSCGAVIVDPYMRIVSTGFNGFARGIKDDDRLQDRPTKYRLMIHAEVNAILFAKRDLNGCAMYIHKSLPCGPCAALIIQSGITSVILKSWEYEDYAAIARWEEEHKTAYSMLAEVGVSIRIAEVKL